MDGTPTLHDVLAALGGGAVLLAFRLLRQHIRGRRVGHVYQFQRQDGRESRVIPRPEAAELHQARQDVDDVRAGLAHLEQEFRALDAKVDDQAARFEAHAHREEEDRARSGLAMSEAAQDIKELIGQVNNLSGQVMLLVTLQRQRRADD